MLRAAVALLLLAGLALSGCSWFATKKQPLPGERISVLSLDRRLKPDPALAQIAISLAKAGGQSGLARSLAAIPTMRCNIWRCPTGSPRHGRPASAKARRDTPRCWPSRSWSMGASTPWMAAPRSAPTMLRTAIRFGGRISSPRTITAIPSAVGSRFWKGRLYVSTGYAQVLALDPANGKVIWKTGVGAPVRSGPTVSDGRILCGDRRKRAGRACNR